MVFIEGAWVDPWVDIFPWDPRWDEYFCCPEALGFYKQVHSDRDHNPMNWITCHCGKANMREIPFREEDFRAIPRPNWCPLRSRSPPE